MRYSIDLTHIYICIYAHIYIYEYIIIMKSVCTNIWVKFQTVLTDISKLFTLGIMRDELGGH